MKSYFLLLYAIIGYIFGLLSTLYIMGFLIDAGVPKGISDGESKGILFSILIDFILVLSFGAFHSITARTSFKKKWTKIIPASIERSTYLFMTTAMTFLLVFLWLPITNSIWEFHSVWAITSVYILYVTVWSIMTLATFQFGHFQFFGLAQAWRNIRQTKANSNAITVRYLYAIVRHPISLGWMIAPLIVPNFTVGHLIFVFATITYILVATYFEENDLIAEHGKSYINYRKNVPAFLPSFKRK